MIKSYFVHVFYTSERILRHFSQTWVKMGLFVPKWGLVHMTWLRVTAISILLALIAVLPLSAQNEPDVPVHWSAPNGVPNFYDLEAAVAEAETLYTTLETSRTEDGAFLLGDPDAPVTIIEFADWACSHCQDYRATIDQFVENYVASGMANLEFRILPTAGGPTTVLAGRLAECADEETPGAFWQAHNILYELALTGQYDQDLAIPLAEALNMDADALSDCAVDADQVEVDNTFANEQAVQGTPAIRVRYNGGDAEVITLDEQTYERSGVAYDVLEAVVLAAQ